MWMAIWAFHGCRAASGEVTILQNGGNLPQCSVAPLETLTRPERYVFRKLSRSTFLRRAFRLFRGVGTVREQRVGDLSSQPFRTRLVEAQGRRRSAVPARARLAAAPAAPRGVRRDGAVAGTSRPAFNAPVPAPGNAKAHASRESSRAAARAPTTQVQPQGRRGAAAVPAATAATAQATSSFSSSTSTPVSGLVRLAARMEGTKRYVQRD